MLGYVRSWARQLGFAPQGRRSVGTRSPVRSGYRPTVENLEDRTVPSATVGSHHALARHHVTPALESANSGTSGNNSGSNSNSGSSGNNGGQSAQRRDTTFLRDALSGNEAEIAIGLLAAVRGTTPAVREFGLVLTTDHSRALAQLLPILTRAHINPTTTLNPTDQALLNQLQGLTGAQFDATFLQDMVTDHQTEIQTHLTELRAGTNPQARIYAAQQLPSLEAHLAIALRLQSGSPQTTTDVSFLQQAAAADALDLAIARLAAQRATNPSLRSFARLWEASALGAQAELIPLFAQAGLTFPTAMNSSGQPLVNLFESMGRRNFDRLFVSFTVAEQRQELTLFQTEVQSGRDPSAFVFAESRIPVLQLNIVNVVTAARMNQGGSNNGSGNNGSGNNAFNNNGFGFTTTTSGNNGSTNGGSNNGSNTGSTSGSGNG